MKLSLIAIFSILSTIAFSQNFDPKLVDSVYYVPSSDAIEKSNLEFISYKSIKTEYKYDKFSSGDSVLTGYIPNLRTRRQDTKPSNPQPISYLPQIW